MAKPNCNWLISSTNKICLPPAWHRRGPMGITFPSDPSVYWGRQAKSKWNLTINMKSDSNEDSFLLLHFIQMNINEKHSLLLRFSLTIFKVTFRARSRILQSVSRSHHIQNLDNDQMGSLFNFLELSFSTLTTKYLQVIRNKTHNAVTSIWKKRIVVGYTYV